MPALLLSVHFHDGRYHGRPDWPPSPARLFQALVAGAARGKAIADGDKGALEWLEALEAPPVIAAPRHRPGQGFSNYVPNNDLDAKGGDPTRVNEIRAPKLIKPILFDAETPFLYLWKCAGDGSHARRICAVAERLYQLGRGIDMAWATGEIVSDGEADARLADYPGTIYRPSGGGEGVVLAAPTPGSLESLERRHQHARFEVVESNRKEAQLFKQPPKPLFRQLAYDSPPTRLLFDLIGKQAPAPLTQIAALTEQIRDAAAAKLTDKLPDKAGEIDRCIVGHGADDVDKTRRVRITPLPSIGHPKTSPAIRRVLVEVPAACPLRADDIAWAFSGLELIPARVDEETGEVHEQRTLTAAADRRMLRHYGLEGGEPSRLWRTITPAALSVARRRIAPERRRDEAKGGEERARENGAAVKSVLSALRHAGMNARAESIRVQREPFAAKGERAETFAHGRFQKERLWHVEIAFVEPQKGPLLIGDGRYLGLGLMHPVRQTAGVHALQIVDGLADAADHAELTRALRRAVMARVGQHIGAGRELPAFFTGHERDGAPARSGAHLHLAYAFDPQRTRLLILAPHVLERRVAKQSERRWLALLETAVRDLRELRAGKAGMLRLAPASIVSTDDPLFAPSRIWESATTFRAARHRKLGNPVAALEHDIHAEARRVGLRARVAVIEHSSVKGVGLCARARLEFPIAVMGPLLIGRDRHFGGGLFQHAGP